MTDDLSEKQKRELIQAVWQIMESFADLGWGIHPLQQVGGKASDKDCQGEFGAIESEGSNPTRLLGKQASPHSENSQESQKKG